MGKYRQLTGKRANIKLDIAGSRYMPLPATKTTIVVYSSGNKIDPRITQASTELAKLIAPIMAKSQTTNAKNRIIKTTRDFWVDFYCKEDNFDLKVPAHLKRFIEEY
jgi:hypothetical protein